MHSCRPDVAPELAGLAELKALHASAHDWDPPDVSGLERLGATRMRQYVRAWINAWDLARLDPAYRPDPEVLAVESTYAEDDAPDGDSAPDGTRR